jgi:shikimate dehydrogenase
MTDVYGIFGHPVGHSRSPAMHNRAFAALGMDAVYVAFSVTPERLEAAVSGARALELRGFNVTLPHKSTIMTWLDAIEPDAAGIGAINTVFRAGPQLRGTNTDALGLTRALNEAAAPLQGASVTVLGAGGAARACVVGLARGGARRVMVAARNPTQADALVAQLAALVKPTELSVCVWAPAPLTAALASSDLLVQATSATLDAGEGGEAFARALPLAALPAHAVVVDIVYSPLDTSLLKAARAHGKQTLDGLGMLLHQAVLSFELWTGRTAPVAEMRAALLESGVAAR